MRIFISLSFAVSFYVLVLFFSFFRHRAKLGLKSWFFIHFHKMKAGGRKASEVARQQAATWFLIIFRRAMMMQTPEAHFIDCNSHYQKHRNTD
jgi:hypothetical protein